MATKHRRGAPSGRCARCGKWTQRLERDHITPLWAGGSNDTANLQDLCRPCHRTKTSREQSSASYRLYLRQPTPFAPDGQKRPGCLGCVTLFLKAALIALAVILLFLLVASVL